MGQLRRQVLVIEDDRFFRRACEVSLRQQGFDVTAATDGEAGLQMAQTGRFDVILLDLMLPNKPGIRVLADLKADERTALTPVVIFSNSSRDEDKHLALELGAVGYYVKANLSLKALGAAIVDLLATPRGGDQRGHDRG